MIPLYKQYNPTRPRITLVTFHSCIAEYDSIIYSLVCLNRLILAKYASDIKNIAIEQNATDSLSKTFNSVVNESIKTATDTTIATINHHLNSNLFSKFSIVKSLCNEFCFLVEPLYHNIEGFTMGNKGIFDKIINNQGEEDGRETKLQLTNKSISRYKRETRKTSRRCWCDTKRIYKIYVYKRDKRKLKQSKFNLFSIVNHSLSIDKSILIQYTFNNKTLKKDCIMNNLLQIKENQPTVSTITIANEIDKPNKNLVQLIKNNIDDFKELTIGEISNFDVQIKGEKFQNGYATYYNLNEQQYSLLMTYLRNNPKVKEFKKNMVKAFFAMRNELQKQTIKQNTIAEYKRQLLEGVNDKVWDFVDKGMKYDELNEKMKHLEVQHRLELQV